MVDANEPVRILLVEDSELDAELVLDELLLDGLSITSRRVENEFAFVDALENFAPDLIVSDLSMPDFSGYRALEIARRLKPRIPFMFVSGTMGEEAAVEALRGGATDYVLKDNLARLASAVRRALAESAERDARERAEQELLRVQRYESLALLASGLSHDLRNILQPISMGASIFADDSRDEVRKAARLIVDCTQRGLDIVASMLSFARGSRSRAAKERVKVSALIEALAMLLRGSMPRAVTLSAELPDAAIEIDGNYTELQQCLLNLCLNALQAMPDGGELRLEAMLTDIDHSFFSAGEMPAPGRYLKIAIKDSGVGMSDEVRSNLFKPFFTTKERGTGLGLSSCRRIVTNHKGFIRVASTVGSGTTFALYLPMQGAQKQEPSSHSLPIGRGEVVLIVIEEASTLSLLHDTIESHGYQVLTAQSGAAALQTINTHGLPAVVVMEADMNLMTGVRTATTLIEHKFRGPVVMIAKSGSTNRDELPPLQRIRFVEKPVNPAELLGVLAEELRIDTACGEPESRSP
jgi:signal transduction histidine kinase